MCLIRISVTVSIHEGLGRKPKVDSKAYIPPVKIENRMIGNQMSNVSS